MVADAGLSFVWREFAVDAAGVGLAGVVDLVYLAGGVVVVSVGHVSLRIHGGQRDILSLVRAEFVTESDAH
ncbi:MAG: hypothetical protein B7Z62_00300 [Deltaproteobacteria bacterium 37-65-8]|nr:MAG: hypothetical protein B7Z62_00300 [Deltaproteobacteria bacterium 37-65-8]